MATIDQVIDIIPDAGHRGVDARTLFVTKQEAFQDAITDAFVPQLNTFRTEVNLLASEVNTLRAGTLTLRNETENIRNLANTQTQAQVALATTQAGIAITKASEASTSANQALTYKNQLQGYVIPAGASYSVEQINTQNSAMTKAQFNALAEERKANRAGSGFDIQNNNTLTNTFWVNVQDGMKASTGIVGSSANMFAIGGIGATSDIADKLTINGVYSKVSNVNSTTARSLILVPTAPNIYPHDTVLTPEQIASGVIKHADASNSGLIVNGKFDTDTSGWNNSNNTVSLSSVDGKLQVRYVADRWSYQSILTVVGKKYKVSFSYRASGGGIYAYFRIGTYVSDQSLYTINTQSTISTTYEIEFTATTTTTFIHCGASNSAGQYAEFDKIAVYPADAISRSDLVFPESYHEDIAEKGVGYPFGNVQYLGGNTDGLTGITNGAFTGFEQYSLFGNWQAPSSLIGKGYVWSSLTESQKKAFIANPENNCYLDGDKTIQVRHRVRVVQGIDDVGFSNPYNNYLTTQSGSYIKPKGKQVSIPSEFGISNSSGIYGHGTALWVSKIPYANELGAFSATSSYDSTTGFLTGSYNGECFALPLALVHRRNQGMYHNVFNPNGTKLASDGLDCFRTTVSFTSTMDCFDPAKLLTASGYIGTVSGRPDGLFYGQVHESDIMDLRNSSKKVEDYNRLITREFNKLVAGTTRGFEGEKYTEIATQTTTGTVATVQVKDGTRYKRGDVIYIYDLTASSVKGRFVVISISANTLTVDTAFAKLANSYMISGASSTRTKSNTLLVCDVIGSPSNYPAIWKNNEVTFTTLHTAEDGTSLLPDGTRDAFKLSRDANDTPLLCLRSTDNGTTWTSFTPTFNTIANAITLTDEPAGNLVLVYYQTKTTMAVPAVNSEVLELGEVLGTNGVANGALVSTLIGKVPTANTAPYSQRGYSVSGYRIDMSTFKFSTISTEFPVHSVLSLAGGASGVPAVKVLPYLTRANGKAYLNLVFKEMKHNGTSWGDSSKFEIVDNVSTTTDNNAQTVLIGQKTVELGYFIANDE